ncbi:MAG: fumarylacetoacetate hydrolase family protein [Myxococcota bacterium]
MMNTVIEPPPRPSIEVAGEAGRFPIRRIFCVGRNYAAHAREMGFDPDAEPPFFFTKPADAVLDAHPAHDAAIPYPLATQNLHHEIELAVAIHRGGTAIRPEDALNHVFGYAVALDLTRRDLQIAMRERGRPWDWGKAFDQSAPVGALHRAADVGHLAKGRIWLSIDGMVRQDADLAALIWPVPHILAHLTQAVALAPGDLVLTGTPQGVGPIEPGQVVRGGIDGLGELKLSIRER